MDGVAIKRTKGVHWGSRGFSGRGLGPTPGLGRMGMEMRGCEKVLQKKSWQRFPGEGVKEEGATFTFELKTVGEKRRGRGIQDSLLV